MSAEWLAFGGILGVLVLFWAVIPVWRGGALWVPTYEPVVRRMLTLADVKPGETVLDLGCGDGRIPIIAAKEFGATGVGVEINFFLVWWARLRARLLRARNVRFLWQDLWRADVSQADVVALFLFDASTLKVGEKLLREAKPSVRVVSHLWKLGPGWRLVASDPTVKVWVYREGDGDGPR